MRPVSTSSMSAWTLSQSTTARWTDANDWRLRSRPGGKRRAGAAPARALRARSPLEPDQETEGKHHRHRVSVEPVPATALVLVPAQQPLRLFVKLLDPVPPVRVLHHRLERRLCRETRPEVLPVALLPTTRPLPDEPPQVP